METTKELKSADLKKIEALLAKIGDTDHSRALRILSLNNFLENDDISLLTDDKLKAILGSDPVEKTPEYKKLIVDKLKSDFLDQVNNSAEDAAKVLKAKIGQELFTNNDGKKFKDYLKNKDFTKSVKYILGSDSLDFPEKLDDAPEKMLARKFINDLGVGNLDQENSSILSKLIESSIEENKGKVKKLVREVDQEKGDKLKLKNSLEKIDDALILGKSQVVLDVMKDRKDRDDTKKELPKTSSIKISDVTSLQRTTDIQNAFEKIKSGDDLFKPLESFDGKGKTTMVNVIKDCIADYGAGVWYKRSARVDTKGVFSSAWRWVSLGFGGDKKSDQTISEMEKEINQKFIKKMDEAHKDKKGKPNHNFMIGTTLAAMDEDKTEYDYKNSKVTFFVKDGEEAKKLGLKEGNKIEVKFTDLTGKYSKDFKNIFQNSLKKYGSEYNKFKNERISLAKEMLQDFDNHQNNIKLYEGKNKLIDAIEPDLVKDIEENKFNKLGSKINYNHDAGRKVTIKINDNNNKLGLNKGDEIIVETPFHLFGASIKQRYREAIDILKNPTSDDNQNKVFIKKAGAKDPQPIADFLKIDKTLVGNPKKLALNDEIMPKMVPVNGQLKSDFSLYQKKENGEVEKIQDNVKQVTLSALYKTSNILNQEVQVKR